jgi:hypothetical protein
MGRFGCIVSELKQERLFTIMKIRSGGKRTKKARVPKRASLFLTGRSRGDQAASSSSSVITGPESWPLADTSRSTNSMIEIGEASLIRIPALITRQ